jgi:hypothetical protein
MIWFSAFMQTRLGRRVAAALAGLALALGMLWNLRRGIRRTVKLETTVERLEGALKADERMDHADTGHGASDDDNRDWLRERGTRRRKSRP